MAVSTIQGVAVETYQVASTVTAYKNGNVVTVIWADAPVTSTSARTTYGTLPVGWRPPSTVFNREINTSASYVCVSSNGAVQGFRNSSGNLLGNVTYVATN